MSKSQRAAVVKKIVNLAGPQYTVVNGGFDETQRRMGMVEIFGEDKILNSYRRGRLLDLTRNAARNSSTFQTILKQFDFNVVG